VSAAAVAQRPIAPDVFTWPSDDPRLLGSRCAACGTVVFPAQDGCPKCGRTGMARTELGARGTLWTWTSQDFLPKSPYAGPETEADFAGYLVGYVELAEGVRVVTRLVDVDRADVRIGMPMELVIVPFNVDPDGTEVLAYAFRPTVSEATDD
jgi:uncharacterized OB-fold protein